MIFYRRLFILISFVFSDYSRAQDNDMRIRFTSDKPVEVKICNLSDVENPIYSVYVTSNLVWNKIFTFNPDFFNAYRFCFSGNYHNFNTMIKGENQGDNTICCSIKNKIISSCAYNNTNDLSCPY